MIELLEKKRVLISRLENGIDMIENAGGESQVPHSWVDGWCELLKQLEAVLDKIKELEEAKTK